MTPVRRPGLGTRGREGRGGGSPDPGWLPAAGVGARSPQRLASSAGERAMPRLAAPAPRAALGDAEPQPRQQQHSVPCHSLASNPWGQTLCAGSHLNSEPILSSSRRKRSAQAARLQHPRGSSRHVDATHRPHVNIEHRVMSSPN